MPDVIKGGRSEVTAGTITLRKGLGQLPLVEINTPWSTAEVYLHGAHVAHFKKKNETPLLFLSKESNFAENQHIRGGVPICFPWFGPREGKPTHGFARIKAWEFKGSTTADDGTVTARFSFPNYPEAAAYPAFTAEYIVTVNAGLALELIVTNHSATEPFEFENCLHTYFTVGDISTTSITGLKGVTYLDKVDKLARKVETNDAIRISSEVDRIYLNTTGPVEIHDAGLRRVIRIEKENSISTVVWNPWIANAKQMPDFGDEEYHRMVCVESGNVSENKIILPPGKRANLKVRLTSAPLG